MSQNKLIGVVVTTAIVILIAVTGGIIYAKKTKDAARQQRIVALGNDLSAAISEANALKRDFKFQDAVDVLQAMQPRIVAARSSQIDDQLNGAFYSVTEAEADYKDKIRNGYTVFEGKLVSPKQKEDLLAKKRQRKEEERQLVEEGERAEEARQDRLGLGQIPPDHHQRHSGLLEA